ncbi:sn-glycerol-3-phosphate transport system permease protein UgpA [bioreactor metagenome]|jgi:ABC-type sugar transport system permease subunit|uniref:sn-glycerol-3-phosphate transport system permease protein UgpA n=1 Tax=bioreactor metagenome TaxID=1076179 RepID=A0A644TVZ7_9ZZZZ
MFKSRGAAWLFVLPALILLLLFKVWPIGVSFFESVMQTSFSGRRSFVGFENYSYLFKHDPTFWNSVKVTFFYSILVNPLIIIVSLTMALLLNGGHAFTKFFRTVFFLPTAISFSVVAVIFAVVLDPYYGLANSFLKLLGLPGQPFFGSQDQALWCIIWLSVWRSAGYWMMYYLAGLQNIPKTIYEAAEIDGANGFQRLFKLTLPLLTRTTSFVLVSNTAFNFLMFAPVYIITRGGPRGSTNLLMYESYTSAFVNSDMGRASAITSILLVIILVFSFIELKITKAKFEY